MTYAQSYGTPSAKNFVPSLEQWNRLVSTSDSSLEGYGVCHAWWEAECVGKVSRVSDRECFRRVGSHRARESALAAAGLHLEGSVWKVSVNGVDDELECGVSGQLLIVLMKYQQLDCGKNFGYQNFGALGDTARIFQFWKQGHY